MKDRAYAKINLSLDVFNVRDDGYHDVRMVMQTIDVCDTIILKKYEPSCVFCQSMDNLITYKEKKICKKCSEKINVLFED